MKTVNHLVRQVAPENYNLTLKLDAKALTFEGTVVITAKKLKPSKRITLHGKDLVVDRATIVRHDRKDEKDMPVSRINYHKRYDEIRLHSESNLYPGQYTITVRFHGTITKAMHGIYPCYFKDDAGEEQVILATQFESHHAREAFPCIDEPAAKATFDVSLKTSADSSAVVLGNMPVLSKTDDTVTFETTPKMSTYLLAFVAGQLHAAEAKTSSGVVVRSWGSTAQPKEHLQYSATEAVRILDYFEDYFKVPYPLNKCDQVALPDFDSGAMENWGLVTYREAIMLVDPKNRSISNEQLCSLVVAHELSHQWFGNLVTMQWWDDLWLNESFASLMEHLALSEIYPDWQQWEYYAASDVVATSNRDIYKDVQSVGVKVIDPDLIETLFDPAIVYAKGCRLLKMLRDYIGDEDFRLGLQLYFQRHQYGNTTREDLWSALSEVAGKDISALMTPWIEQSGMPLVTVNQTGKDIALTQSRFILDKNGDETQWPIPLLADTKLSQDVLTAQEAAVLAPDGNFVVLNQTASGHFVTLYENPAHLSYITSQLENAKLPAESRINVLNDMLLLARRGDISLEQVLSVVRPCDHEPRDNVWSQIMRALNTAGMLTEGDEPSQQLLRALKSEMSSYWFEKLGWDDKSGDDPNTKQLRHTALALQIAGEDRAAVQEATDRYNAAKSLSDLPAEIRNTILGSVVRSGDEKAANDLMAAYQGALPDIQQDIASALGSTKDAALAKKVIHAALGEKGFVRTQDIMRWLAVFLRNHYTRSVAWDFIVDNWGWLENALGSSKSFDYLPVYCAGVISTPEWEQKFHRLFDSHAENKMLERNIQVGTSDIKARVAWRNRDEAKIKKWLGEQV